MGLCPYMPENGCVCCCQCQWFALHWFDSVLKQNVHGTVHTAKAIDSELEEQGDITDLDLSADVSVL